MQNKEQRIPHHVAIVMDGNGRWAKKRHLPRTYGHKKGVDSVREVIRACNDLGVKYLTLFAFSSENWKRPQEEVSALMSLFMTALENEAIALAKNGVRLRFIGDTSAFPERLQEKIRQVEKMTATGDRLHMNVAANYGGRWDIVNAARRLAVEMQEGKIRVNDINRDAFANFLSTSDVPDPDLFIRTGGEQRVSNFLLWQIAYAELYFTDVLWPDFKRDEFNKAIDEYSSRQRRYGKTGDQITGENSA